MHRTWVAVAATLSLVLVSVPASADFHPTCAGSWSAYANTELAVVEDDDGDRHFSYRGIVSCPGAVKTIEHLEIANVDTGETLGVAEEQTCQPLRNPCIASGTIPLPDERAFYRVNMTFDTDRVTFGDETADDVERLQRWLWEGIGQPVLVCAHAGAVPAQAGHCPVS